MDRKLPRTAPVDPVELEFWLARIAETRQSKTNDAESRHSLRRAIPLHAVVNHGFTYSAACQVRDLSLSGAFIDLCAPSPDPGAIVEVVLRYNYRHQPQPSELRIPAKVVNVQHDGVALAFEEYDDDVYTQLVKLLYAL